MAYGLSNGHVTDDVDQTRDPNMLRAQYRPRRRQISPTYQVEFSWSRSRRLTIVTPPSNFFRPDLNYKLELDLID